MATVIDASAIFSGAPVSILYGTVECGATISVPKFELAVTAGSPDFTNAVGPVMNTEIIRKVIPSITLEVDEITAEKIAWAMPGAALVGGVITWGAGRVASTEYKDLVLTEVGADGSELVVTIMNALSAENQSLEFSDDPAKPVGLSLKFTGYVEESTPKVAAFSIALMAGGS